MKKLGSKGFMMAEVIIVSTIILTTLVGLYTIFNRMYIVYTERSYYNNIDAVYALKTIYNYLIENNQLSVAINDGLRESDDYSSLENSVKLMYQSGSQWYCNGYIDTGVCSALGSFYSIQKVILTRYDENAFTNVKVSGVNTSDNLFSRYDGEVIISYFDYLFNSMDFDEDFNYLFIIELKIGENYYYGNYRIR